MWCFSVLFCPEIHKRHKTLSFDGSDFIQSWLGRVQYILIICTSYLQLDMNGIELRYTTEQNRTRKHLYDNDVSVFSAYKMLNAFLENWFLYPFYILSNVIFIAFKSKSNDFRFLFMRLNLIFSIAWKFHSKWESYFLISLRFIPFVTASFPLTGCFFTVIIC